jgi:hypothetical protein
VTLSLRRLAAESYQRHALHHDDRAWVETNCYVDLWIEVLHAFGHDPTACLGFTVATDFEGDQWLFFKQPTQDLFELYGVDVQELTIYDDLLARLETQLARGRLVMVELDAHHLPDTAGVTYRTGHSKTTVGIETLDVAGRRLGYFHNAGYFTLSGEDFAGLFGLDRPRREGELVPYTEFVKFRADPALSAAALTQKAVAILQRHLARRPLQNPVAAFRPRFLEDVRGLKEREAEAFHGYAFATLRQCGSAYELAQSHLAWLSARGEEGLVEAEAAFGTLASQAKTLQFKTARGVLLKREVDLTPMLDTMESAWERALMALVARYG